MLSVMEVHRWPSKFPNPLQHLLVNYNNPHSNILCDCNCYAPHRVRSSDQEPHLNIIMAKCAFKISLFLLGSMFPFNYLIIPSILNFGKLSKFCRLAPTSWQQRYILLGDTVQKVYMMQYIILEFIWYFYIHSAIVFTLLPILPINLFVLGYLINHIAFKKLNWIEYLGGFCS